MKVATVVRKYLDNMIDQVYLIESHEDLEEYKRYMMRLAERSISTCLNSDVRPDRIGHLIQNGKPESGLMSLAIHMAGTNDLMLDQNGASILNNPIYQMAPAALRVIESMKGAIDDNEPVIANYKGGWMPVIPSMIEVLSVKEGRLESTEKFTKINKSSKILALENDTKIKSAAEEYLNSKDPNWSFIKDLRDNEMGLIQKLVKQFVEGGGSTIFVSTTGIDWKQISTMVHALSECGITDVILDYVGSDPTFIDEWNTMTSKKVHTEFIML